MVVFRELRARVSSAVVAYNQVGSALLEAVADWEAERSVVEAGRVLVNRVSHPINRPWAFNLD